MSGYVWILGISAVIIFWTFAAYGSDSEDNYVDERYGDASIADDWGLDRLKAAAERERRRQARSGNASRARPSRTRRDKMPRPSRARRRPVQRRSAGRPASRDR